MALTYLTETDYPHGQCGSVSWVLTGVITWREHLACGIQVARVHHLDMRSMS